MINWKRVDFGVRYFIVCGAGASAIASFIPNNIGQWIFVGFFAAFGFYLGTKQYERNNV